jgi:dynein heavy chain, axonemal
LEILGQASDSHKIQPHLLSIFENIQSLEFHPKDYDKILSVSSKEMENIQVIYLNNNLKRKNSIFNQKLIQDVRCKGNVEEWLSILQNEAQKSLHDLISKAYFKIAEDEEFKFLAFFKESLTQV